MSHYPTPTVYSSLEQVLMAYESDTLHIENVFYTSCAQDSDFTVTFTTYYGQEVYTHDCCADDFVLLRQNTLFHFIKD